MPRRVNNWDCLLTGWARDRIGDPFIWGITDCVSLLRQALAVMYGEPIGPALAYESLRGAMGARADHDVRAVLLELGAAVLPGILYAGTGDVLIAPPRNDEPFDAVMVVITDRLLFTELDTTVQLLPLAAAAPDATVYRLPFELEGAP